MATTSAYILYYDWTQFKQVNVPTASESAPWIVEKLTDSELSTWTDNERYMTAAQLRPVAMLHTTRATNDANWDVVIAHWLASAPKVIQMVWYANAINLTDWNMSSSWFSDWTTHKCSFLREAPDWAWVWQSAWNTDKVANFRVAEWSWAWSDFQDQAATVALDGTNITLTWTKTDGWYWGSPMTMHFTIMAQV